MTSPDPFQEPIDQGKFVLALVIIIALFLIQQCAEGRL